MLREYTLFPHSIEKFNKREQCFQKARQDAIEIQTLKRKNKEADHRIINHTYLASHQQSQNVYLLMILMF